MWAKNQLVANKNTKKNGKNSKLKKIIIKSSDQEKRYRSAVVKQQKTLDVIGLERYQKAVKDNNLNISLATSFYIKLRHLSWLDRLFIWAHKNKKIIYLSLSTSLGLFILILSIYNFWPQTISFSFSQKYHCSTSISFLTGSEDIATNKDFKVSRNSIVTIGNQSILSDQICVIALKAPLENHAYRQQASLSFFGLFGLNKSIKINTRSYPSVSKNNFHGQSVPLNKILSFNINSPDTVFSYILAANNKIVKCTNLKSRVSCALAKLDLAYSTKYDISLARIFNKVNAGVIYHTNLETISATVITNSSIAQGSTVFDKPQSITLTTDKHILSLGALSLSLKNSAGQTITIPTKTTFIGSSINVSFSEQLPRKQNIDLHISNLTATDQSTLSGAYDLNFYTSGGPKVSNINLPSYGVDNGQTIAISFDQALMSSEDPSTLASLIVNGVAFQANYSISGNHIYISPSSDYPVCATIEVKINSNAANGYGINGDSGYDYKTRSHCYSVFSIGTSVQGRPITVYKFGSGPSLVLYIANMEGNEQNSANLLTKWIPNVDANPGKIPSYRTIVIIPSINPDGYAADTRLNANGIDLNRNFPSNNWQTQVTEPLGNGALTNDGGAIPLSEPESQALANYFETNKPRLTLTEHSHGAIVEANDAGDSDALGEQYARIASYRAVPTYAIGNFFAYSTTGAFEDWANNKFGLPVLEIELQSPTNDEYLRNLPALWAMAQVSQ